MEYDRSPAKRRKISHPNQDNLPVGSSGDEGQSNSRKKLLVLDVNGLLVDIVADADGAHKPDTVIASKSVFKRPYCDEFLEFCFERFRVGVWTSRTRRNITRVLDFLMKDTQHQLLFCWDQSHCTETGYNTIENTDKPLLLKELKKLWEKQDPNLPWDKRVYDESNTLLLDDSPYKALRNPPNTAIFPYTYSYQDTQDNGLGPNGDLRNYLEKLAASDNVQKFVEQNPFGQPPITRDNESWDFYHKIICSRSRKKLIVIDIGGLLVDVVTVPREGFRPDTIHGSRAVFKRSYCDDFLQFCFERFNVGVWTSTPRYNTQRALDYLMKDTQHKLLFCWDLAHCTDTGFVTVENNSKKLLLKEIRKLWEKKDPNLPWELGEYDESNTLLVDNASHRALLNPPHTAIFPYLYRHWHTEDNSLGPDGDLRVYLERLAASENVQKFVSENPFGQRPIREKNLSWGFYQKIIRAFSYKRKSLSEPRTDSSTALAAPTLLEPETDDTTALVGQTLSEPEVNATALTAPTLLEPETDNTTTLVGQTLLEPEVSTTALTAPTLLEPETNTTTDLVGQSQALSEPEVNTTAFTAATLLEPETNTTTDLVGQSQTLSEPKTSTTTDLVGPSQSLSEPEVNTTAPAAQILSEPETFTSDDAQTDVDNVSVGLSLSAKNTSFSPTRSESNSGVNGLVTCNSNKRIVNSIEDSSHVKRFQSSAGSKGNTQVIVSVLETSGSYDTHHDIIVTHKSGADDGKSCQKRKGGKPQKSVVKEPIDLPEGSSCLSPLDHHVKSLNQAVDYQRDWPFIKQSTIWPAIESLMSSLTPPQKPHFSPLKNTKEFNREGLAIGHMVTYLNLVQKLSCLKPDELVDKIHDTLDTLVELETHGFDASTMRDRLNELLCLKYKVSQEEDARKEIEKCEREKILMDEKIGRLKLKMHKLQETMVQNESMKKMKEEEIMRLQLELHLVCNQISDFELDFEKLAATPL